MIEITNDELRALLLELAAKDLADGANLHDHPCAVAVRRLDECEGALRDLWAEHLAGRIISRHSPNETWESWCHACDKVESEHRAVIERLTRQEGEK